ncbi:DUF4232 domain-containing protein [Amnibacterium kyonggiense]
MSEDLPSKRCPSYRLGGVIAVVVAAAVTLSGCSTAAHTVATAPVPAVTVTVTPSSSTSVFPTPASTPSRATGSESYRSSRCLASQLDGVETGGDGAAGSVVVQLVLRNTGTAACTLQGWPGVSFIDGSGHQVGAAAALDRSSVHQTVTLARGGQVQAALKIAQAIDFPKSACAPVTVRRLRVYPPGSTQAIQIDTSATTACSKRSAAQLTVQAFTPSS